MNENEKDVKTPLTLKEREVLSLVSKGFTNKQIAEMMKISPSTVNVHLDHIYRKLGCSNRVEACFIGLKKGLFPPLEH
ncbi:MAG: response regulator transcription factor [Nitrospiraceae bacterium]|nr:response regulator transcription factor [Nitrospiraceae bacterium]MDA8089015.1 response regulator transcription factor [Nitrospiraceae bacterium]